MCDKSKTKIFSIEGNIGSGKSTLVKILEQKLHKIIELNKKQLSTKSFRKKSDDIAYRSDMSDILMENYTSTHDEYEINYEIDLQSNSSDNTSKIQENIIDRILKYIMTNAFGVKTTDWTKMKICFLVEPVDEWNEIVDSNNITILEKFYAEPGKYAFSFQMMAYISRLKQLRKALSENYDIIITERCVHTDKEVFARMLYDDDKIGEIEYSIYNTWFKHFLEEIPTISVIYIRTAPAIAHNRVIKRARQGEFISLEYLTECHNYHEKWLTKSITEAETHENSIVNKNLLVLNGDVNHIENPEILNQWLRKILEFIYN